MDNIRKRGEIMAEKRAAESRSAIKAALAKELPDDMELAETTDGIIVKGRRLAQRLADHGSLRDIGFLTRSVR